jgi:hypothetical protein
MLWTATEPPQEGSTGCRGRAAPDKYRPGRGGVRHGANICVGPTFGAPVLEDSGNSTAPKKFRKESCAVAPPADWALSKRKIDTGSDSAAALAACRFLNE